MGNNLSRKYYRFSHTRAESIVDIITFVRLRYRVANSFHIIRENKEVKVKEGAINYTKHGENKVIINFKKGSYYYDYLTDNEEISELTRYLLGMKHLFLDKITQNI
jgi:hypothetical protein